MYVDITTKRFCQGEVPDYGAWAAARKQGGRYGVTLGKGRKVMAFIPGALLTPERLERIRAHNQGLYELVVRAMCDLPRVKASRHQNG